LPAEKRQKPNGKLIQSGENKHCGREMTEDNIYLYMARAIRDLRQAIRKNHLQRTKKTDSQNNPKKIPFRR